MERKTLGKWVPRMRFWKRLLVFYRVGPFRAKKAHGTKTGTAP